MALRWRMGEGQTVENQFREADVLPESRHPHTAAWAQFQSRPTEKKH